MTGHEEVYMVQANRARCFLCQPSAERFVSHVRDGSWTLCSDHMRQVARIGDATDEYGTLHAVGRS